jgi:hypothetical protein
MTLLIDAAALHDAPNAVRVDPNEYVAIKIAEGDLDFEVAGVVNSIATPLGRSRVPILYVSTFATDIFLVPHDKLHDTRRALEAQQFLFVHHEDPAAAPLSDQKSKLFSGADHEDTLAAPSAAAVKAAAASAAAPPAPVSYAPPPPQPHIVFSILPFDLRMVRVSGDLTRFATELLRLILYPKRQDRFFAFVRLGANELSIICERHEVQPTFDAWLQKHSNSACSGDDAPPAVTVSPLDWRCVLMCTRGSGLSEFGVMARFTGPLAESSISIFKVTTISNDYSLLRTNDVERALEKLQSVFANVEIVREEALHSD